jgi:uncharacterized protein (TIGR02145 family)
LYYDSQTAVAGACAYASNYPPVAEYNISVNNVSVSFTGTPPYDLVVNTGSGTASAQAYTTYNLFAGQTLASFTDKTGAPGIIKPGYNQPQGGCTFMPPAVVGTFANFHNTSAYSSSTYVTLTDERDNKNYTVVKIGGRWIMAQNLNYQTGLTWQANSNSPSTVAGSNTLLIGSFWCPGGYSSFTATSTRTSCDVWGALYSWETAMSLDGKITTWSDVITNYCSEGLATTHNYCKQNWGRTSSSGGTGGRGICPPNWHVPTDNEWGILLDGMEGSSGGSVHQNATTDGPYGTNAGSRGKASCTCPSGTDDDSCVNDTDANWYYNASTLGTDYYNFRVLPSGYRSYNASFFIDGRGNDALFWSSSASVGGGAWVRYYDVLEARVRRYNATRSHGFSVRCIRD